MLLIYIADVRSSINHDEHSENNVEAHKFKSGRYTPDDRAYSELSVRPSFSNFAPNWVIFSEGAKSRPEM